MWAWWWLEQRVWRVGKWRPERVVAGWVRAVVECGVATMGMVAVMVLRVDSCGENSDGG